MPEKLRTEEQNNPEVNLDKAITETVELARKHLEEDIKATREKKNPSGETVKPIPESAPESLPKMPPEVVERQREKRFFNTKDYFEYRLENATAFLNKDRNDLLAEEAKDEDKRDKKKINELKDEITHGVKPAIKRYERILSELNDGNAESAKAEVKKRMKGVDEDIRSIQRENPGKDEEQLKESIEGHKDLLNDRNSLVKILGELSARPEQTKLPEKEEEPKKPEETPRLVVADALDQEIEKKRKELEELRGEGGLLLEPAEEDRREIILQDELVKLEKQKQQEIEWITGRNFAKEARNELAGEGHCIDAGGKKWIIRRIPKGNAIKKRIEKIGDAEKKQVFENQWKKLSDQEKTSYNNRIENFKNKLEQQREALSRETGVEISQDMFCQFLNSGTLKEVKKTGFFRKKITVPMAQTDGTLKMKKCSVEDFANFVGFYQKRFEKRRRKEAEEQWQKGQEVLAEAVAARVNKRITEVSSSDEYRKSAQEYWQERVDFQAEVERESEENERIEKEHRERLGKITRLKKSIEKKYKIKDLANLTDKKRARRDENLVSASNAYKEAMAAIEKKREDRIKENKQTGNKKIIEMFKVLAA